MSDSDAFITFLGIGILALLFVARGIQLLRRRLGGVHLPHLHTSNKATMPLAQELQSNTTNLATSVAPVDSKSATIKAIAQLPLQVQLQLPQGVAIPLLQSVRGVQHLQFSKDGHWGVFGATGSGKGNALQVIALSVLHMGPDRARLIVLDAKGGLDYNFCKHIEHATLYAGNTLPAGCSAAVAEMGRRINLLASADARNIAEYNKSATNPLPLLAIICDEIADFDKSCKAQVETLARMGRAAGCVLFVATQHPTVDVLSSQVQANLTNRLVFRLVSSEYSRVALRRLKDDAIYEPSIIPQNKPGVAVLRRDTGNETIGRVPELTDDLRSKWVELLAAQYPKIVSDNGLSVSVSENIEQVLFPLQSADRQTDKQTDSVEGSTQTEKSITPEDKETLAIALIRDGKGRDQLRGVFRRLGLGLDNNEYSSYLAKSKQTREIEQGV